MSPVTTNEAESRSTTETTPIRVLVVDDSAIYRKVLRTILSRIEGIEVVGIASNGKLALQQIDLLKPDLLTLDIEMPEMSGLEVLHYLKKSKNPPATLIVSSHTAEGAQSSIEALSAGAFDFIIKPICSGMEEAECRLKLDIEKKILAFQASQKVDYTASHRPPSPIELPKPAPLRAGTDKPWSCEAVGIGISTGGPESLRVVLSDLPPDFPVPIYIVQHMPPIFTKSLANSLNSVCKLRVVEAEAGMEASRGNVYIAPGGTQMRVITRDNQVILQITKDPPENSCQPSVDYLFRSLARVYRERCLGVIMTGMGTDGTEACRLLHKLGARVVAQDRESCVVFGMPRQPIVEGLVDEVVSLKDMAACLTRFAMEGSRQ